MHKPSKNKSYSNFPNPLASVGEKLSKSYGKSYAKAIEGQWGSIDDIASAYSKRSQEFHRNRDYAYGTQDTSIYKQILSSLDTNAGDGTLLNIDWSPVPIVPKFVRIVVNKILARKMYPNVEAIDPISMEEKEREKAKIKVAVENKGLIEEAKALGVDTKVKTENLPETTEEAEIFMEGVMKSNAEIAAQLATAITLEWNDFDDTTFRRCVEDLVINGMAVTKRSNDPNYGIKIDYVDPANFVHSHTDDPNFKDVVYAGHVKRISIQELKRLAGSEISEEEYEKLAKRVMNKSYNNAAQFNQSYYDKSRGTRVYGYDEYLVDVLDFEFLSVDDVIFEEKESRFGNVGFYYKGHEYTPPKDSIYKRNPVFMSNMTVYGGSFVMGCDILFDYGIKKNIPKNIHDITRARLSYSIVATNIRRHMPKSMVNSVIGFADQLQLTHLKIQQAIAKAKPDGIIVDIEGLENVQLGRGGELQPLDIQDIYEQTGVFYYRSKNPEGGFQNPPIRTIDNTIRNINELIALYNHYLRMIRDVTGVNEVMDASTPRGEQLVGVRQQALQAANNAIYDMTNAAGMLYKRVCEDVVKCLQILPDKSAIYGVYEKAIGKSSMEVLSSFKELPMYNYGIRIVREMSEEEKMLLETNIQQSLAQRELDLEDAIAIRHLHDIDQAERLLVVRRKKRIARNQQQQQQNIQMQAEANTQTQQAAAQAEMQRIQLEAQAKIQAMQTQGQIDAQILQLEYQLKSQLEQVKMQAMLQGKQMDMNFRQGLEDQKDNRKDERVKKQAVEQSKLISQRQGQRSELTDEDNSLLNTLMNG